MTPLLATPVYARDVAIELAAVEGKTFDLLDRDERDRYYMLAAWVVDDFIKDDDFHEGCVSYETADEREAEAFKAGYEEACSSALAAIEAVGRGETDAGRRAALREAYKAARGTESGEAMDAMIAAHVNARRRSE